MILPPRATVPTMYFIGVTTTHSSIMRVFPEWARLLGLGEAALRGIDLPIHADPEDYRQVVHFIRHDPLSQGALVTTHKIDLYAASRESFDWLDPYARTFGELSCISKREGKLAGLALDPVSSGHALEEFVPGGFWREHGGEALILGAGGSAIAIAAWLMRRQAGAVPSTLEGTAELRAPSSVPDRPSRLRVTNRSRPRLDAIRRILGALDPGFPVEYALAAEPEDNDRVLRGLPPRSLVVNATGLGKDRPGSPLTDAAVFPEDGLAWELNYRGDLRFLKQARAQQAARRLRVEDGWAYFIHGWALAVAEVFHLGEIRGPLLERLRNCSECVR